MRRSVPAEYLVEARGWQAVVEEVGNSVKLAAKRLNDTLKRVEQVRLVGEISDRVFCDRLTVCLQLASGRSYRSQEGGIASLRTTAHVEY